MVNIQWNTKKSYSWQHSVVFVEQWNTKNSYFWKHSAVFVEQSAI